MTIQDRIVAFLAEHPEGVDDDALISMLNLSEERRLLNLPPHGKTGQPAGLSPSRRSGGKGSGAFFHDVRSGHADRLEASGLRHILIHQYFAIDVEIIWDIVQNKLPDLELEVRQMLAE